jgi:hypothetical protein
VFALLFTPHRIIGFFKYSLHQKVFEIDIIDLKEICILYYSKNYCHKELVCEKKIYKGVSKSFRIDRLERELQMIQLSATRCSCIAIL